MGRKYLNMNVYEAILERIKYIFDEFTNIYVAFSGGKDSGLLLNLMIDYMKKNNIKRKIGLFHQDFEAQYLNTTEYVTKMFEENLDYVEPYWVCLPMASKTPMSNFDLYWYPWDDQKEEIWVRPMPEKDYVINLKNNPLTFYKYKMPQEELFRKFSRWYRKSHGGSKTICLLGTRADESLIRYSSVVNKKRAYDGKIWITSTYTNVFNGNPLYDWSAEDVWIANGKLGFPYNHLYDLFYKAGLTVNQMRVASPFNEWAVHSLNIYRIIEPSTWVKLVGRIQGANFTSIYGKTKAMGYRRITLPVGYTWKKYTQFLLQTLPATTRKMYQKKFRKSVNFWHKIGGGLPEHVIEEIKSKGYKVKRNGVSPYTKDGKCRIIFVQDIPDHTDDIKSTVSIPSWKRMCYCILKNDHLCRFMGFGETKEYSEKIKFLKEKYKEISEEKIDED